MTALPVAYRTLARPGLGLALIAAPDGRVQLWAVNRHASPWAVCAQCGAAAAWHYRTPLAPARRGPHLCRPCVEGAGTT
jgi:hypothetical protein